MKSSTSYLLGITCFVASLGGVLFGFDTAVISGTFSMVETQFELTKIQVGWFGSSALVGAILGAFMAGGLSDRWGRRPILKIAAALFFISALFSAIPPTFFYLILARLVGGIGVGMASVLSPLYISEISPAKVRGRLVALYQLSIVVGILLAYFSNWYLIGGQGTELSSVEVDWMTKIFSTEVWRGMFAAEMIPSGLFFILLFFIPESPRWLMNKGRQAQGWAILQQINPSVKREEIRSSENRDQAKMSLRQLLKPGWRQALAVGIGLSVFGQFTGVNIVIYYGPSILESAGWAMDGALQFQVLIGLINLIFTLLALTQIDRWGRRPLLIGGMISVFLTLCGIGFTIGMSDDSAMITVILLCMYIASLALSINAVIWVLIGEIYPTAIRGQAMSIATFANWGTNFAAAFLFPWYVSQVGMSNGFYTFAAFCFVAIFFFYRWVPETKGLTLEEIEGYWMQKKG